VSHPGRLAAGGLPSHYRVQSQVPVGVFRLFLEAVKGNDIQITNENVSGLSRLCEEFGLWSLSSKLSVFRDSPSFKDSADAGARSRISALEEGDSQQERRLAALGAKLSQVAQLPVELALVDSFDEEDKQHTSFFLKTSVRLAIVCVCVLHLALSVSWSKRFLKELHKDSGHPDQFISMAAVSLILGDTPFSVGLRLLSANCDLFANDGAPSKCPYRVTSKVPLDVFRQFIGAIEGESVKVTNQNFKIDGALR
jgi:hypothetical protein